MGRMDKVVEAARKAGYIESDESPEVMALSKGGQGVKKGESFSLTASVNRWALLATDRGFHAIRLGQVGFGTVKEHALGVPYAELEADIQKRRFRARRKDADKFWFFDPVPFGSKFKDLIGHLESRGVQGLPEHPLRDDADG
jgi:hypothetical protein